MRRLVALAAALACGSNPPPPDRTAPALLRVTPAQGAVDQPTSQTILMEFDEPVVCSGAASLTSADGPAVVTVSCAGATLTATANNLAYATTYTLSSAVADLAGNVTSCTTTFRTRAQPDTTPPVQPGGLTAAASPGQIELTWGASSDDTVAYTIARNDAPLARVAVTHYTDTQVVAAGHYCYAVRAVDAAGNESIPATACADAVDSQAPTTPANLAVTVVSLGRFDVSWSASSDDVGVAGYEVQGTSQGWTGIVAVLDTTSFSDTTLTPGETYCYAVRAFDASGNRSAYSAQVCQIDDFAAPSAPTRVEASTGLEHVTVRWWPSDDDVGVVGYDVFRDGGLAGTTSQIAWTDELAAGPRRCYTVVAFDGAGRRSAESAAACAESWPRTYGGAESEGALAVAQFSHDFAVAGFSGTSAALWRLTADGSLSWKKTYAYTRATAVVATPDGGLAVAGWADASSAFLMKTDDAGAIAWHVEWQHGAGTDRATAVDLTADGGYVVGGYTVAGISWVLRTNATGTPLSEQQFLTGTVQSVHRLSGGGFVVAMGNTGHIVKLDSTARTVMDVRYGDGTIVFDAREAPNGDLVASALEADGQGSSVAPHLIRVDAQGALVRDTQIGPAVNPLVMTPWRLAPAGDGFAVAGFDEVVTGSGFARFGSVIWTSASDEVQSRSPSLWATLQAIAAAGDGGVVAAGFASTTPEAYVVKLP